jgi:hypothetical protein
VHFRLTLGSTAAAGMATCNLANPDFHVHE